VPENTTLDNLEATKAVSNPKCRWCGGTNTRLSRRKRWADVMRGFLVQKAWRCRDCRKRFYLGTLAQSEVPPPAIPSRSTSQRKHRHSFRLSAAKRRRTLEMLVFAGMLVLFFLFLHYLAQEQSSPGSEGAFVGNSTATPQMAYSGSTTSTTRITPNDRAWISPFRRNQLQTV
jgi:hypothetical protein